MKLKTVAFDPGNHCGIAWRNEDGTEDATMIYENLILTMKFITDKPEVVVYEDFKAEKIDEYGLYTVRLIGWIQAMCWYHKVPCVCHTPQTRYPYIAQARSYLKRTRLSKGYTAHERDALAHLYAYEARNSRPTHITSRGAVSQAGSKVTNRNPIPLTKRVIQDLRRKDETLDLRR